jgi:hypothetical protein
MTIQCGAEVVFSFGGGGGGGFGDTGGGFGGGGGGQVPSVSLAQALTDFGMCASQHTC